MDDTGDMDDTGYTDHTVAGRGTPRPWFMRLPSPEESIMYDYYNPVCECGGGTVLGSVHEVSMYENHRSIDCIIHPRKTPMPYLSSSYFNYLKMFESIINNHSNYEEKIIHLLQTWKNFCNIYSSDPCSGTHVFMHYAASESAFLILNSAWKKITKKIKKDFTLVFEQILYHLQGMKSHVEAIKYCHFLLSLIKNPWDHHYLPKILNGNSSQQEVADFIQFEKSNIYVMRIRMLCENDCEALALKLSSSAMKMRNFELKSRYHNEEDDFEFIRDVYYACLAKTRNKGELINHLQTFSPKCDGKFLLQRYCLRIQHLTTFKKKSLPRICEYLIFVCEMAAFMLVINCLYNPIFNDDFAEIMTKWSILMFTLMESDFKSYNDLHFKDSIQEFVNKAPTARHIYLLIDILDEKFGSILPLTLYIEIYIKALETNIKEKHRYKILGDKEGILDSLKRLVQGYLKLANLLVDIVSVCRECVLTAYSLMPSEDLMVRVKNLAILSGKHVTDDSENSCNYETIKESTVNVKPADPQKYGRRRKVKIHKSDDEDDSKPVGTNLQNTYHKLHSDLNKLPDPLSSIQVDYLISLLKYPRYNELNWDLEWSKMKIICDRYLNNIEETIKRNMILRSDLKFVDIDINKCNEKTKECMNELTNQVGYFSSDDSSDDDSLVSNISSGETEHLKTEKARLEKLKARSRNRNKKFGSRRKIRSQRKIGSRKNSSAESRRPQKHKSDIDPKVNCVPVRRNLRSQRYYESTGDLQVNSLSNDKTQSNIKNCDVKDNFGVKRSLEIKNNKPRKKSRTQQQVTREKRTVHKNQHQDFDYSWRSRRKRNLNKKNNSLLESTLENCGENSLKKLGESEPKQSCSSPFMNSSRFEPSHRSNEHLKELCEIVPQLSSLDFLVPVNTDRIVNVVQIQTTSNTLSSVSQTQTDHVSNHHSNSEIEKNINDGQTKTHPLDNFVSLYQSNSLNSNMSTQNSEIHQGECSFTGSVSVSNQRITESITNTHNVVQQEPNKSVGTHDMLCNQNQINLDHRSWNDTQFQNSTVENAVHLSSNVIVRTSDVVNPNHISHTTGQTTNTMKKPTYCNKTRERFMDLSLPASISSVSTSNNRSSSTPVEMITNKSNFDSKIQQNSPFQTSIGLQVNFNNHQSEDIQSLMSPNNQLSHMYKNISENSISTNIPLLNDQVLNSINSNISGTSSLVNPSFLKEISGFDNIKPNMPIVNPVSSTQTQTCFGLQQSSEVSNPISVISSMNASTHSQVIKTNLHNSFYTSPQNQRVQLADLGHTSQTNRSDEQKKIDNLKLMSQTFTATSEAIKFVSSSSESQCLTQSAEKHSASNLPGFDNAAEGISNVFQESNINSKSNRGRGNIRTYESKTRALKQANMSDMFVFEKGTLYAVQDDVNRMEPTKSVISSRSITPTNIKAQNRQARESLEKPKSCVSAAPNITVTGSMLPRFQQVFGKTKFQSSTVINDNLPLCSISMASNLSPNPMPVVNRTNISTTRVYSTSKGVQTNHDIDLITSNTMHCITPTVTDNKLQQNMNVAKTSSIGNNQNNVIMTCKTISTVKNIAQVTVSSHQLLTSNIDTNDTVKKEVISTSISSSSTTFTSSCNNSSVVSSSSNVIYSIPIQSDLQTYKSIEKPSQCVPQIQRQLKMSPSIIQTVLRKHPNWQQNSIRQGKQSIEVQTSPTLERSIPVSLSNIIRTTIGSSNKGLVVSTSKSNISEPNVSSSMMEQVREFESVLEEVRKSSLMNEMSTASMLPQINHEIIQMHSPTDNVDLLNAESNQTLFPLNKKSNINNEGDHCSFSFLNQTLSNVNDITSEEKEPVTVPTIIAVRSVTPTPQVMSPKNNNMTTNPVDGSPQCSKQMANILQPVIKTPESSPSTSAVKVPVLQKPLPKLQEDEQTTQRIYAILDKYAEQLRNSPELKNKPAPRRRTNPPTNPSVNAKRKKPTQLNLKTCSQQTSCSSSGMDMSPTSDMQAIDSEDSSNAVSHFSHINNSPSRNSDEHITATVISETPLIENTLINVREVLKKINIDAELKSKVSQSTQIVVSGTSGSFLSIPESSAGNVRLLVAAGKNQKMYRLHCPVTGSGPVLIQQITTKDSCSNHIKMPSNILGQNINESAIMSALTTDDLRVTNIGLGNEIVLNTSQNSTVIDRKINKSNIILQSIEKAPVHDNKEKKNPFPIMKKSQACQSTFSVIHTLPDLSKPDGSDKGELISEAQNNISESIQNSYRDNDQKMNTIKQEPNTSSSGDLIDIRLEKLSKTLQDGPNFIPPDSLESSSIPFEDLEFPSFHSPDIKQKNDEDECINKNIAQKDSVISGINSNEMKIEISSDNQTSANCVDDNKVSNNSNNLHVAKCENVTEVAQEEQSNIASDDACNTNLIIPKKEVKEENKPASVLNNVDSASTSEVIFTSNQTSNSFKEEEKLSPKVMKTEHESENEEENTMSNAVYNMLDNQSDIGSNTKIESLIICLKNDRSLKNWKSCLSKIMSLGTEKILEGENLKQLQESFEHAKIETFKDLKIFVLEQCKLFGNNDGTSKEYDLYDDIDSLGVDKPSKNELFPEVAILNDLDKSVSPTLGLLQASTSKSNNNLALQVRRKSVLSHTTTNSVITASVEQTPNVVGKKNKTKVSFLKRALCNEMNHDSNDCETKSFINGSTKSVSDSIEQSDSSPESPSNTTTVDSETCMSEDSTSTISSGAPHYNFRKSSKRKNVEEDGFIESQVIKRMYRGRTLEDNEDKSEIPKTYNSKAQTTEQKSTVEKKESNKRRISSRLKNNSVKNNQLLSPQLDCPPYKITNTRTSLRRVPRKTS